jgi:hypothetical protein
VAAPAGLEEIGLDAGEEGSAGALGRRGPEERIGKITDAADQGAGHHCKKTGPESAPKRRILQTMKGRLFHDSTALQ